MSPHRLAHQTWFSWLLSILVVGIVFFFMPVRSAYAGKIIRKKLENFDRSDRFEQKNLFNLRDRKDRFLDLKRRRNRNKFSDAVRVREFSADAGSIGNRFTTAKFSARNTGLSRQVRDTRFSSGNVSVFKTSRGTFSESKLTNRNTVVSRKIQRNRFQVPDFNL